MAFEISGSDKRNAKSEKYHLYFLGTYKDLLQKIPGVEDVAKDAVNFSREIEAVQARESQVRKIAEATFVYNGKPFDGQTFHYFRGGKTSSFRAKTGHIGITVEFDLKKYLGKRVIFASIPKKVLMDAGYPTLDEIHPNVQRIDVVPWRLIKVFHEYEGLRTVENNLPAPIIYESPGQRKRHRELTNPKSIRAVYT